ncbi:hypothetical protein HYY74_07240 [Candidatus Woesearchaeota archaeon]|nr:hypothetical protein [Candidatus Woesearchaeota archaeon]
MGKENKHVENSFWSRIKEFVRPANYCICNQNACEEVDYTRATDEPICNRASERERENCLRTVENNKLKERGRITDALEKPGELQASPGV